MNSNIKNNKSGLIALIFLVLCTNNALFSKVEEKIEAKDLKKTKKPKQLKTEKSKFGNKEKIEDVEKSYYEKLSDKAKKSYVEYKPYFDKIKQQGEGFIKENEVMTRAFKSPGTQSKAIFFITDGKNEKVLKQSNAKDFLDIEIKGHSDFMEEGYQGLEVLNKWLDQVNSYNKNNWKLPIITRYLDHKEIDIDGKPEYFSLLEKASGKELKDYIENFSTMDDKKIEQIFINIGEQFGRLDALMIKEEGKVFGWFDLNQGNIMFDEKNMQVYTVDNANIRKVDFDKLGNNEGRFSLSNPFIYDICYPANLYPIIDSNLNSAKNIDEKKEIYKKGYKRLQKGLLADYSFGKGACKYNKLQISGHNVFFTENADDINKIYKLGKDLGLENELDLEYNVDKYLIKEPKKIIREVE